MTRSIKRKLREVQKQASIALFIRKHYKTMLNTAQYLDASKKPKTIVSLTSYGYRIESTTPVVILSLLNQTVLPDKIVLYLAYDESVPDKLMSLKKYGLEIRYVKDTKSYKKLIPALHDFPDSTIVTVDDDVVYPRDWFEKTIEAHLANPNAIIANRAREIRVDHETGTLRHYTTWRIVEKTTADNAFILPVGVGGVLYPPHVFDKRVTDEELFQRLAPHADDMWFWAMSELIGTRRVIMEDGFRDTYKYELDVKGLYNTVNASQEQGNQVQFSAIIDAFPELKKKLSIGFASKVKKGGE